jgi:ferredoxin
MSLTFRGDRASYIPVRVDVKPPSSLVVPTQVVEQFIQKASFRFVLDQCLCRSLEPCRNYPKEIGCLFLGEGAKEIAPSLGREVTAEEALVLHRKAMALGLIPMMGRLRWDSIWLGVKGADQLLTICHCCDCCCYFGIYRHLPEKEARGLQKLEGLEIRIDDDCDGCGICVERCFIKAMTLKDGRAVAGETCRGCGRCSLVCPRRAVSIVPPSEESLQKYMQRLCSTQESQL